MSEATETGRRVLQEGRDALEMLRAQGKTAAVDFKINQAINHISAWGEEFGDATFDQDPKLHAALQEITDHLVKARVGQLSFETGGKRDDGTATADTRLKSPTAAFVKSLGDSITGKGPKGPPPPLPAWLKYLLLGAGVVVGLVVIRNLPSKQK